MNLPIAQSYLLVHFDACDWCCESEFGAIAVKVWISVGLDCVQIGGSENAFIVVRMVQNEFTNTLRVWIVIVHPIPDTNITVRPSRNDIPIIE